MATDQSHANYHGRFAPSPTGPLHLGSLVAAIASYSQALSCKGRWSVRIDDIDPPREVAGAADDILQSLALFGFPTDALVFYQSDSIPRYAQALQSLREATKLYACECSRKTLANAADPAQPGLYPGHCRDLNLQENARALRFRVNQQEIGFADQVYGQFTQNAATEIGDFIVRRRDGLYSYQLANVVDDHFHGITEVVRGVDLLDNTPRQLLLIDALGYTAPRYLHLPVVTTDDGAKLSKQNGATALPKSDVLSTLWQAWCFLGQAKEANYQTLPEFWQYAERAWEPARIPATAIPVG